MSKDLEYEKNNIGYDQQYPNESGGGIKCKNYEICNCILPKCWFDYKGKYLCQNCDMLFGTWLCKPTNEQHIGKGELPITDNLECPICLEKKRSVTQPRCDHTICIDCFKRCWNYDNDPPTFPYPEIIDEWEIDENNPKWYSEYPLIKNFDEDWELWDTKNERREENEDNLRKCPICRI